MTANVDVVNRALQAFGSRTTVTATELANNSTNEAIQANLILGSTRDQLLRMAPWDCSLNTINLNFISSVPGTPENSSAATSLWQPGQPAPPWAYEYQYPVDCLRMCWLIPSTLVGYTGVPITTAVTGGVPNAFIGPPIRYKVQIDMFYPVLSAVVAGGGSGYVAGDFITCAQAPAGTAPVGAPVVLQALTVDGGGALLTVAVVNQVLGEASPLGGSYFGIQANPVAQGSTTGVGSGATFTLTQQTFQSPQRVVLTNQEFATATYVKQITDPNVMDPLFIDAWVQVLGAYLCIALSGDKALANMCIGKANQMLIEARKVDGNEGLTVNDMTPDWIRTRGVTYTEYYSGPYSQFDWGPMFAAF